MVTGNHDWFNVFQDWEEDLIDEIINDPVVISAVHAVSAAASLTERINALNQLMERIG